MRQHPQTVLVIDDEKAFCDVVAEILEASGIRTLKANDASQAAIHLETSTPDLILCDIMMPDMDGLTFIRQLKNDPDRAHIPIIIVTAKATDADEKEALSTGAVGFLAKPFSAADLEAVTRSYLDKES